MVGDKGKRERTERGGGGSEGVKEEIMEKWKVEKGRKRREGELGRRKRIRRGKRERGREEEREKENNISLMKVCWEEKEATGWEPGKDFLFRFRLNLTLYMCWGVKCANRGREVGDWRCGMADRTGVEGDRKWVGVTVWVKGLGGWAGSEQNEGCLK